MNQPALRRQAVRVVPRWRIYCGDDIAVGPGKIELLARVQETGSLMEAAKAMDMSYMRAWLLVKTMNRCFTEPVVALTRGGKAGGGAVLTEKGQRVLSLYQELEEASLVSTRSIQRKIIKLFGVCSPRE